MFLGQYQHSLDDKGRLTIPSAFRDALGEGAFISRGFDRNIMVMTAAYFQQVYERLTAMSITEQNARQLRRLLLASAFQVDVDKAGRVLLPQNLRQYLNLENDAVLVGQGEYFEIWTPTEWATQMAAIDDAEANAQRFSALNLGG